MDLIGFESSSKWTKSRNGSAIGLNGLEGGPNSLNNLSGPWVQSVEWPKERSRV